MQATDQQLTESDGVIKRGKSVTRLSCHVVGRGCMYELGANKLSFLFIKVYLG